MHVAQALQLRLQLALALLKALRAGAGRVGVARAPAAAEWAGQPAQLLARGVKDRGQGAGQAVALRSPSAVHVVTGVSACLPV